MGKETERDKYNKSIHFHAPWPCVDSYKGMYDNFDFILSVWIFLFVIWIPVLLKLAMVLCGMFKTAVESKNEPHVVCLVEI